MHNFYLSKILNTEGEYDVHTGSCVFLPRVKSDCIALGNFDSCNEALKVAVEFCDSAKCCFFCCHQFGATH